MKDSVRIPKKLSFNRHEKGWEQFSVLCFLHVFQPHQLHCRARKAACGPCMTTEIDMLFTYRIMDGHVTLILLVQKQWKEEYQKPFSL